MKYFPTEIVYSETFQVSELQSGDWARISRPFSSLRGWSVSFTKAHGKLWAGVQPNQEEDIVHVVIRNVQITVRGGSIDWKSGDLDFPHKWTKTHSGLPIWRSKSSQSKTIWIRIPTGSVFSPKMK